MTLIVVLIGIALVLTGFQLALHGNQLNELKKRLKALETQNADHRLEALNGRVSQLELRR